MPTANVKSTINYGTNEELLNRYMSYFYMKMVNTVDEDFIKDYNLLRDEVLKRMNGGN